MRTVHRLIPSTRGAWRRAFILSLYIIILAAALSWQAFQYRADTVYVYRQGDVIYAQAMSDSQAHPLFPLLDECRLRWTNGEEGSSASRDEMTYPVNAGDWLLPNSRVALHFESIGDVTVIQGSPWVTIRSKAGDLKVMADCPPPPPTTHHVYIYVAGDHLFMYDTLVERLVLLMPLQEQLVWSGDETGMFTMGALVTRPEDKMGYEWLPAGATVLGDFETAHDVTVNNLDETQVQLRYGTHELMLVSHGGW
jgi:hypothetical protein